jgi:hypothetical protein
VVAAAKEAVVRGFDSLPVHPRASSSVGTSACLTNRRSLVRGQPCPLIPCGCSSAVERPLETRGAAGSIPAGHIIWLRSSTRQSTRLLIGRLQVRSLRGPLGRTATGAVSRFESGWVRKGLGGSTPSPSFSRFPGRRIAPAGRSPAPRPASRRCAPSGERAVWPTLSHSPTGSSDPPGNRERRKMTEVLEAWPRGKAAPCYGVGRLCRLAGSSPAASAVPAWSSR